MSFLRPEALGLLARLAEPVLTGVAAGWLGMRALSAGGVAGAGLGLLAIGAAAWCVTATNRAILAARAGRAGEGAGVVEIAEGRIVYYGPEAGGMVDLDRLAVVAAEAGPDGGLAAWALLTDEGERLRIPGDARGAAALPDALAGLPGFDSVGAPGRLARGAGGTVVLWRRPRRTVLLPD